MISVHVLLAIHSHLLALCYLEILSKEIGNIYSMIMELQNGKRGSDQNAKLDKLAFLADVEQMCL